MDASPVTIRPLDAATLTRIEADVARYWVPGRTPMVHHLFLHQFGNLCFAAVEGHEVAGFVLGLRGTVDPDDAYVHLIGVRDDYRRRGLARLLYATFRDAAAALGAHTVSAMVRPDNAPSIAFHEQLGMTSTFHADHTGPGNDRLVFRGPVA